MSLNPNLHSKNALSKVRSQNIRWTEPHYLQHSRLTQMGFWRAAPSDDYAGWTGATATEDTAGDGFDHAKGLVAANRRACVEDISTNANDDTWHYANLPWVYMGDRGTVVEFAVEAYQLLTTSAFIAGLGIPSSYTASVLDGTAYVVDGVGFIKATTDAELDFFTEKNGADATYTNRDNGVGTIVAATWHTMVFRVTHSQLTTGTFMIEAFLDGNKLNLPNCEVVTSGFPDDLNLGLMLAHRGAAGNYIRWGQIDINVWEPGEYVG